MKAIPTLFFCLLVYHFAFSQAPSIEWAHCFGGSGEDLFKDITLTIDSEFLMVGSTNSNDGDVVGQHGNYDMWVVKLDSSGNMEWQKCLGGTSGDDGKSISELPDSGYIIAGHTISNNGDVQGFHGGVSDIWVVRLDKLRNIKWQRCLGGSGEDDLGSIITTIDGGYILTGSSISTDGDLSSVIRHGMTDYWVVKLDSAGVIQWQRCYGGSSDDWANSVTQTLDTGYLVCGTSLSTDGDLTGTSTFTGANVWVIKIDSIGNIIWKNAIAGAPHTGGSEFGYYARQQANSKIFVGSTCSNDGGFVSGWHGLTDYWVVKLSSGGLFENQISLGGTATEELYEIYLTQDEGCLAIGNTVSNDGDVSGVHQGDVDFWVVKIDSSCNLQWQKCLGGSGPEYGFSVTESLSGAIIVAGEENTDNDGDVTCSTQINSDAWVVKLATLPDRISAQTDIITDFSIYQNLICKSVDISFYTSENKKVNVQLIDITGRIIWKETIGSTNGFTKHQIFTGDLVGGIYFVKLQADDQSKIKKVIIQ